MSRPTVSRGRRVSASSVITNRTSGGGVESARNVVSRAPRNSRLSSDNFPRLRSHPIQRPSPRFQRRRRCRSRKRSPTGVEPYRRFSRAMPSLAAKSSSSSPSACSLSESRQSDSKAKCSSPRGLARKWISSCSTCVSMSLSEVRRVGTAMSVRRFSGTPLLRSIAGSSVARNPQVTIWLTTVTAKSTAGTNPNIPRKTSHLGLTPTPRPIDRGIANRLTATMKPVPT